MVVLLFLSCHILLSALVVVSFLCGQWPIFDGTFIRKIHNFIVFGAYDHFLGFVGTVFGTSAIDAILRVEHCCCNRPNPVLQSLYLIIIGTTYYFINQHCLRFIPQIHRYTSFIAVAVGVLLFLLTSFADPGTVHAENVSCYLSAYPYDNVIYSYKECSTCRIPKPARSKHCSICDRCVARFDHHCGWMNNCIGERNTRYFMAFLIWHFVLCLYGVFAVVLVLLGEFKESKIAYILTVHYGINKSFYALAPYVVQWLLAFYNPQVLLIVFIALAGLLLAGFFGYHAKLCVSNTTTNETFKWQEYVKWKKKADEAKECVADICAVDGEGSHAKNLSGKLDVDSSNMYDNGFLSNIKDVLLPPSSRSSFWQEQKSNSASKFE